jgi:hypothetical protein
MGRKLEFDFIPFTHDQIRGMSEEDLYKNINHFKRMIREASRIGKMTQAIEVEFCYLDHERIMRERSRQASSKFHKRRPSSPEGDRRPRRTPRFENQSSR